jgi:hypothetical protein
MGGEHSTNFVDPIYQRMTELLILKMRAHSFYHALPELFAAFLMNRLVANNSELMNTRRHKDQHRIALARFVHAEPTKLLLRRKKGISVQLAALDENANLTGSPRFRFANSLDESVVLKPGKEFSRSHFCLPTRSRAATAEAAATTAEPAESATATATATGGPAATTWDKNRATSSR